ncbi:MAG: type II secretion system protein [Bdellovibrionales bacterium]|nr:type II secretion system protein [Bdellovibrionales bacterium]
MKDGRQKGFTLIEILVTLFLVAILSVVLTTQFVSFRREAGDTRVRESLIALRAGIANQHAQMQLRCGSAASTYPPVADIAANNITNSACTTGQVTNAAERQFVKSPGVPTNFWGSAATVTDCQAAGDCTRGDATACNNTATFTGGWCYNSATGEIWADSQSNGGVVGTDVEEEF